VKLFYYLFHTFELLLVHAYESDSMIMLRCPNVYFYDFIEKYMGKIQGLFEIKAKAQEGIGRGLYYYLKGQHIYVLHALK